MGAYSADLRKPVLEDSDAGLPTKQAAEKYQVSSAWVRRLKQRRRETGEITPRSSRPKSAKKLLADHLELLEQLVRNRANATLEKLRSRLPVAVSVPTLSRPLLELKLSFKKKSACGRARPAECPTAATGLASRDDRSANRPTGLHRRDLDQNQFHAVTWSCAPTALVEKVPHSHWKTTTFVAALRSSGLTAPLVVDGPINGRLFLAYVRQHLAPTLRPGDIVVQDNLSSLKVATVQQAIEGVGAQVANLTLYSPDFNPLEQVFAKLKSLVRKAKQRTVEGLRSLLGQLLDRSPPPPNAATTSDTVDTLQSCKNALVLNGRVAPGDANPASGKSAI